MPPRQITSYFQKLPAAATSAASATTASPNTARSASSTSPKSPKTTLTSSSPANRPAPSTSNDTPDRPAKRAKLGTTGDLGGSPAKTASTFGSALTAKAKAPRASSREELRAKLCTDEKRKGLLGTEVDTMGEDWLLALQDELSKPYFLTLKEFITTQQATKKVFPPAEDVYSWSRLCPLKDVRVVIIGQDPYHDDGQAHGLAFSVRKGVRIPPSLRNIYKEMHEEVPAFTIPKHGDLTEWAKHGVLLLNTSLTVRAHEAGSHSNKGWETFTAAVLKVVTSRLAPDSASGGTNAGSSKAGPLDAMLANTKAKVEVVKDVVQEMAQTAEAAVGTAGVDAAKTEFAEAEKGESALASAEGGSEASSPKPREIASAAAATPASSSANSANTGTGHVSGANGVCFMAWGAHAQKMCSGVDTKKHLVLKSVHPSPLAAMRGFFGNKHFIKANEWLEERYGPGGGIDWAALGNK